MVTALLINNDAFQDVRDDPEGFVFSILKGMNEGGMTRLTANGRHVGWCDHAHHSSTTQTYQTHHTRFVNMSDCTCGYGGFHEPLNERCEINR